MICCSDMTTRSNRSIKQYRRTYPNCITNELKHKIKSILYTILQFCLSVLLVGFPSLWFSFLLDASDTCTVCFMIYIFCLNWHHFSKHLFLLLLFRLCLNDFEMLRNETNIKCEMCKIWKRFRRKVYHCQYVCGMVWFTLATSLRIEWNFTINADKFPVVIGILH